MVVYILLHIHTHIHNIYKHTTQTHLHASIVTIYLSHPKFFYSTSHLHLLASA